ncbi:hypothetical protein [Jiella marina]|uniref:hypothetical protein n=1 Tax=Jiella sp. LLJ827 TaxID=2917712 RepID=UPI002100A8E7|nr:hypothetical protein [Jiella sp. LLJ827]MCQ0986404.1 hypothetical protein [Jiella sp. LLJ827]
MAMKRYRLVDPDERVPFRGRLFKASGEMMDDGEAFTRRLLREGSIEEVAGEDPPLPAGISPTRGEKGSGEDGSQDSGGSGKSNTGKRKGAA